MMQFGCEQMGLTSNACATNWWVAALAVWCSAANARWDTHSWSTDAGAAHAALRLLM